MPDLDKKDQDLDVVFSVIEDCAIESITFWELVPVIQQAIKKAYPEARFKIIIEVE